MDAKRVEFSDTRVCFVEVLATNVSVWQKYQTVFPNAPDPVEVLLPLVPLPVSLSTPLPVLSTMPPIHTVDPAR